MALFIVIIIFCFAQITCRHAKTVLVLLLIIFVSLSDLATLTPVAEVEPFCYCLLCRQWFFFFFYHAFKENFKLLEWCRVDNSGAHTLGFSA